MAVHGRTRTSIRAFSDGTWLKPLLLRGAALKRSCEQSRGEERDDPTREKLRCVIAVAVAFSFPSCEL